MVPITGSLSNLGTVIVVILNQVNPSFLDPRQPRSSSLSGSKVFVGLIIDFRHTADIIMEEEEERICGHIKLYHSLSQLLNSRWEGEPDCLAKGKKIKEDV